MKYVAWVILQLLLFTAASVGITVYLGGEKIDSAILFMLIAIGYRIGELHYKVDKLLKSKYNALIKW